MFISHRHKGRAKNISTRSKHRRSIVNFMSLAIKSVGKKSGAHITGSRVGPRAGLDVFQKIEFFSLLLNSNRKFVL